MLGKALTNGSFVLLFQMISLWYKKKIRVHRRNWIIGKGMGGAWYESLRIEGLQVAEEEEFCEEWQKRTEAKDAEGRYRECPAEILEKIMGEEKWTNVRVKVVRMERENKNRSGKFQKMKQVTEEEEEKEVIVISSSEEEIEEIILSSGEEKEERMEKKAERCQYCGSYGCRGAETARRCIKCGYLTLKCWMHRHQKWCKNH